MTGGKPFAVLVSDKELKDLKAEIEGNVLTKFVDTVVTQTIAGKTSSVKK
ncbi:hypothetical protein [Wolbachia endosymbiont of Ctenocephalides felis wCfeT]|nr:hypothetical protein [Wolbachia endosymbiont of Ctenocephalides felis wCfeT]